MIHKIFSFVCTARNRPLLTEDEAERLFAFLKEQRRSVFTQSEYLLYVSNRSATRRLKLGAHIVGKSMTRSISWIMHELNRLHAHYTVTTVERGHEIAKRFHR